MRTILAVGVCNFDYVNIYKDLIYWL